MELEDIIKIVDKAYDHDGMIMQYHKAIMEATPRDERGKIGDTLAEFIVLELHDAYDPEATAKEQVEEALRAMESASNQLRDVMEALADA